MAERVVSVKMPHSLVDELRRLQKRHHYLDLSEQLRSIVRQRCLEIQNPYSEGIKKIRGDIEREAGQTSREQVLQELIRMLKEGER